ncbi:MAG: CDP-diacylglycerol--serine O-phosphatidyltransferase, partial [Acidobacteriota bacterium]
TACRTIPCGSIGAMLTAGNDATASAHFSYAAIGIGVAVVLDGLDGRIARLTNTVSDFGREMDSLADVITFGIAPAVMAFAWGIEFTNAPPDPFTADQLHRAGYFFAFLYLICGAMRLARFNVQVNPVPKNPGLPGRKYFVGMPIPAAAAIVAAIIFAAGSTPLRWWGFSFAWLGMLALLAFLMVSTWRYPSFKDLNLIHPESRFSFVAAAALIYLVWSFPQPVLLVISGGYGLSGIIIRLGGILRRRFRGGTQPAPPPRPEHQVG